MHPKIKKYKLKYSKDDISWAQKEVEKLMKSGWLTQGTYLEKFEKSFCRVSDTRFCLGVSSGTAALEMLYWVHEAHKGSIVIPTNTFFSNVSAALNIGSEVILADIDPKTMSPSPDEILKCIRKDTKVVCIVHVGGVVTPQFDRIREICNGKKIKLIEDASHAHGATHFGKKAGSLADGAAFSMHHSKVLTSGEGGIIAFDDESLLDRLKKRRFLGLNLEKNNWEIHLIGQNYKLSEISCILGLVQLRKWRYIIEKRRQTSKIYDKILTKSPFIHVIKPNKKSDHGLYKYVILLSEGLDKRRFIDKMEKDFKIEMPPNVYDHPCHTQLLKSKKTFVNRNSKFFGAEEFTKRHVCLPMYVGLTVNESKYIANTAYNLAEKMSV